MKKAFSTILIIFSLAGFAAAQETVYGSTDVRQFREMRDRDFRNAALSPLLQADFVNFKGLLYFAEDDKFVVKAKLEKTADKKIFTVPTSVGTSRRYIKYGILKFDLDGKSFSLIAFQPEAAPSKEEYRSLLFIPFRDQTNGKETYGAGRYMDINAPAGDEVTLNFNLAYNPSCAYGSERYSCPLPPKENFLEIEIKAGEKAFPYAKKQ
jgi:uncharacterized protein (DUF1684 family)